MDATFTQRVSQPLLITADDCTALARSLSPHVPPPTAMAECADGLTRHFASVEELVTYDNAPSRGVRSLTLESRSKDYSCSFTLTLESDTISNVRSSIRGTEESVLVLKSAVEAFLSATRPPYWPLAGRSFWFALSFLVVGLAVAIALLFTTIRATSPLLAVGSVAFFLVTFGLALAPTLLASLVDRLRNYLFPTCIFAWQQGKKRAEHLSFIRTVVLLGLLISAAGSILAAFVTS